MSGTYDPKKSSNMAKFGTMFKSGSAAPDPAAKPHVPKALEETLSPSVPSIKQSGNPANDKLSEKGSKPEKTAAGGDKPVKSIKARQRKRKPETDANLPPSRQGKVQVSGWVEPIDKQRIDMLILLGHAENKEDFLRKAVDLFQKEHGKLPI